MSDKDKDKDKDADKDKVEVFETGEGDDKVEVVKKEDFDKAGEVKDKEIKELNAQLDGQKDKSKNLQLIRKGKDKAETKNVNLEDKVDKLTDAFGSFKEKTVDSVKDRRLNELAGDDEDLKKKINVEYDSFAGELFIEGDIFNRMDKAFTLATGKPPSTINEVGINKVIGVGAGSGDMSKDTGYAETEAGKSLAASLGMEISKAPPKKEDKE